MEIALLIRLRVYSLAIKFSADFQVTSPVPRTATNDRHIQDEAISERTSESHSRGTIAPVPRLDICSAYVVAWGPPVFRNEGICMNQKIFMSLFHCVGRLKASCVSTVIKNLFGTENRLSIFYNPFKCNISDVCVNKQSNFFSILLLVYTYIYFLRKIVIDVSIKKMISIISIIYCNNLSFISF